MRQRRSKLIVDAPKAVAQSTQLTLDIAQARRLLKPSSLPCRDGKASAASSTMVVSRTSRSNVAERTLRPITRHEDHSVRRPDGGGQNCACPRVADRHLQDERRRSKRLFC